MTDSLVRCDDCGREALLAFADGLSGGWPKCYCRDPKYGMTMRLIRTKADIDVAVGQVVRQQTMRSDAS